MYLCVITSLWGLPITFYGSLVGALLSGLTAVGLLWYQIYLKNKEYNFRCYGTMKIVTSRLAPYPQYSDLVKSICNAMEDKPEIKSDLKKQLENTRTYFENTLKFLEDERANIPYDFISRYYTVTNTLEHVLEGLKRLINEDPSSNFQSLEKLLNHGVDINNRFIKNGTDYIKIIEKKYKARDFY
ncbi:hypothetical protein [Peribacillus asahii]|uniref:hypothetical protein n=1 Tax=Peribacillus asahii TaxID=228899 RepID=UPI00207A5649|nr:hypothetical protein [Peribacillus asahii]USK71745.1 hypothetical protein LIS76_08330 [Peribacillus asahii]